MPTPEERLSELNQSIESSRQSVNELIQELKSIEDHVNKLVDNSDHAHQNLNAVLAQIGKEIEETRHELQTSMQHVLETVDQTQRTGQQEQQQLAEMASHTMQSLKALMALMQTGSQQVAEASQSLLQRGAQSGQHINGLVADFKRVVAQGAQHYTAGIQTTAQQVDHDNQQAHQNWQQTVEQAFDSHLAQRNQKVQVELQQHVATFGNQLLAHGENFSQHTQQTLNNYADHQRQQFQDMVHKTQALGDGVGRVVDGVTDLAKSGVEGVGTVIEGVDAVNVGLKVTIGTLNNVKSILEEINL